MPTSPKRGESYALKFPEPIQLWKWAARNSRRHSDGLPLGLVGFYKRAVRGIDRVPPETHGEFVSRALLTATRGVIAERLARGETVPPFIEELLAQVGVTGEPLAVGNHPHVGNPT